MQNINMIGYASGVAAGEPGCKDGPVFLHQSACWKALAKKFPFYWEILNPTSTSEKLETITLLNRALAESVAFSLQKQEKFVVVGGDHSSGIGTWSGATKAIGHAEELGLIWIDAHLDAHIPETTPSGNIHGMPLAILLGYGYPELVNIGGFSPKLKPENLYLIGMRSYEEDEKNLLERLNIRICYIDEVKARGFDAVFQEALTHLQAKTKKFGVSIDIDALDPSFVPGTGTPEADGLTLTDVTEAFMNLSGHPTFLGLEIAEFNPHLCPDGRTAETICQLIAAALHFQSYL